MAATAGEPPPELESHGLNTEADRGESEDRNQDAGESGADEGVISVEIPDEVGRTLLEWIERGVPFPVEGWVLNEELAGLAEARAVVINVRNEGERAEAERMASEIRRIWKDPEVARDLYLPGALRRPPSITAANLADPRDEGSRKAVARIKRAFRRA